MVEFLRELLDIPILEIEWEDNKAKIEIGDFDLHLRKKEGVLIAHFIDRQFPYQIPQIIVEIFETYASRAYVKFADMRNAPVPFKPFLKYVYRRNKFRFLNIMEGLKNHLRIYYLHSRALEEGEPVKDFFEETLFSHELFENKILIMEMWKGFEPSRELFELVRDRLIGFLRLEATELSSSLEVIRRHAERSLNIKLEPVMGMDRLEARVSYGRIILSRETHSDSYLLHLSPPMKERQKYHDREPLLWNIQAANAPYADGTISDIDNDPLLPSWSFKVARIDRNRADDVAGLLEKSLKPSTDTVFIPSGQEEHPVIRLLRRYRQVIIYGPVGTGKTHLALRAAREIAGNNFVMLQIHPSYSYEEFMEGIRPDREGKFAVRDGIFKRIAMQAYENPSRNYVVILDEFNRGNVIQILGELLYALEYRGSPITLPYSGEKLVVPENLYLIATMNTTDRSIDKLDMALKRRFAFYRVMPDEEVLKSFYREKGYPHLNTVLRLFRTINERLKQKVGEDLTVGHTLFMAPPDELPQTMEFRIMPIIRSILHPEDAESLRQEVETILQEMEGDSGPTSG